MSRILFRTMAVLMVLAVGLVVVTKIRYGGETVAFPDRTTEPMLPGTALEVVARLDEAPGNIAVSATGRVFISFHPEGNPRMKVAELVNGQPVAFPSAEFQSSRGWGEPYFNEVYSLRIDSKNRLWTLDPGFHGLRTARLLAFDLDSKQLVHRWDMPHDSAGIGSYVQDFQITSDARFIYVADSSALGLHPALISYDIAKQEGRRVLENEPSVTGGNYKVLGTGREMTMLNGLYKMHPGVDSIALDHRDVWVYYGPMSGDTLYRVPQEDLRVASRANINAHVERFGAKPQSDGLTMDSENSIYITDVEHNAIFVLNQKHELKTLIRDPRIRWADGMSLTPDGWLYFTDSDLPDLMLGSRKGAAPFFVYRVKVGKKGRAGS